MERIGMEHGVSVMARVHAENFLELPFQILAAAKWVRAFPPMEKNKKLVQLPVQGRTESRQNRGTHLKSAKPFSIQ